MGNCTQPVTHCMISVAAVSLACLHGITHQFQNLLNTCWYRLALITINRLDRWPNLTTGRLGPIPTGLYSEEGERAEQYSRQDPTTTLGQIEAGKQQKSYYRETLV